MKFQFFFRVVYGFQKAYPANKTAQKFARLIGVKTFSADQLHQIQELGFELDVVLDPEAPLFGTAGEKANLAWEKEQHECAERQDLIDAGRGHLVRP
jgi:hypothetical protein